ncbi:hypothetical protein DPMN_001624 [Dreissena polymorpha]|uniref:Uncharacterized protein n=1 Tax=Dreissena polymorpha TaxID=45954 RepID=A0A9D4MK49_DREPO|nr:hypothetical protein DPMN_001624 [Dreissena polymorpha]
MPEIPVGTRLLHFLNRWLQITSDAWVHSFVAKGLTFQFQNRPPLSRVPIELVSPHPHTPESIRVHLEKQAVERVQDPYSPGFYSRVFLVKRNGSWRPAIDSIAFNIVSTQTDFQDTDSVLHTRLHQTPALGGVLGLGRCILPCSYTSQLPEVLAIRLSRPDLPVPSDAIWVGNGFTSLYQTNGCGRSTPVRAGYPSSPIFGRLAVTPARLSFASASPRILLEGTPILRTPSKCGQVRSHSFSRLSWE